MKLNSKRFILSLGAQSLTLLLLAAAPHSVMAQELVVAVESAAFALDTSLSGGSNTSVLAGTAASPAFTLDTRLAGGNPTPSPLVVTAESGAFVLNTRLAGFGNLIVESGSPPFDLNTMWIGI